MTEIHVQLPDRLEVMKLPEAFCRGHLEIGRDGSLMFIGVFVGYDVHCRTLKAWASGTWRSAELKEAA